ncbi:hypothetical protein BJY01DRAFT_257021 [Aspergillus pseudoustus]|uniref:TRP C-terminal domain-containing protein n=1 Tax=Aspergillus pseudoustus TaxID=1810923 RepID=A0ABR4JN37_9EURO
MYSRYNWRTYAVYKASFPLDHAFHFSTLDTQIKLRLNDTDISCIRANITPDFGPVISRSLVGIPIALVALSGLVTGVVHTYQKRRRSTFRYELEGNQRDPAESSLPGLGPCLHYIQFVFLTGCLTIPYPGFFRAAVSKLAWSSLIFKNWPVTHQFAYPGIEDGLYSVNATYGLEEMAQYLGSTTTSDLWTNSLVNLALIGVGTVVVIQLAAVYGWLHQLHTSRDLTPLQECISSLRTELRSSFHRTAWSLTRLVLNYTLPPLISLSLFQAHNARWFPGHTSVAMIIVAALAGLRVLVLRHLMKTNRLALFAPQVFLPASSSLANSNLNLNLNLNLSPVFDGALLYGIPLVRGIAVGALQQSGLAQTALLAGCEVFILAHAMYNWRAAPAPGAGAPWRYAGNAFSRLVAVSMGSVFLPQVAASERTKGNVAYAILALHATLLISGFMIDCIWEPLRYALYKLGALGKLPRRSNATKPPVFGIKQLAHRSTRRVSFGRFPALDPDGYSPPTIRTRDASIRHVSSSSSPPSIDIKSNPSFRAPRRQTASTHIASLSEIPLSPGSVPRYSNSNSNNSSSQSEHGLDTTTIELQSFDGGTDAGVYTAVNDPEYYAQRESDQYYRWKKRQSYHTVESANGTRRSNDDEEDDGGGGGAPGPSGRLWPWTRAKVGEKKKKKGFEVIRPAAVRPGHPNPDQTPNLDSSPLD